LFRDNRYVEFILSKLHEEEKLNGRQKYVGLKFCFGGHFKHIDLLHFKIEIFTQLQKRSSYNNSK